MSRQSEFFLNSRPAIIQYDLLEMSHPGFSKIYRIVRNATRGITVTLEDATLAVFDYYPVQITSIGSRENLDYGIQVDFGDLGTILPLELDRIATADSFGTKPIVKYRTYRSDDLTAPLFGPVVLQVTNFAFVKSGSSFEAKAPDLNINKTGELYRIDRFTTLRGFL